MFYESKLMTILNFVVGWILAVKYRVMLRFYYFI